MSFEKAKAYLEVKGYASHIIIPDQCSGTVEEAANALGVQPCEIAFSIFMLFYKMDAKWMPRMLFFACMFFIRIFYKIHHLIVRIF